MLSVFVHWASAPTGGLPTVTLAVFVVIWLITADFVTVFESPAFPDAARLNGPETGVAVPPSLSSITNRLLIGLVLLFFTMYVYVMFAGTESTTHPSSCGVPICGVQTSEAVAGEPIGPVIPSSSQ